ncbi:hypothetical protein [Silvibacterium dinghuense]|uniref:Quinol:cytochrome c oxidoreductase quinone-binding subunit 2 n=1 Tax=Silvibacterium dinghuense TaxID=1560006 RepID=A0A4Q1SJX6_9BACT|nr:hypothetical protein [Silvibacterium dinghuense]RXS97971.1 hypothetical protein ESZ00_09015 [Silvibacterium dinghuense]GGH03472.1 hypothetical protein GCM10011586_19280 [Silvibacterium dinghuense]
MSQRHQTRTLPAELAAPAFVAGWRTRALVIGVIFAAIGIVLAFLSGDGWNHFFRAWLLGLMITFGFAVGGQALLMVQYLSGGKWGLLVRRPLEAMSRTLLLPVLYFIPIAIYGVTYGKLYLWAQYPNAAEAAKQKLITNEQAHAIIFKHGLLNPKVFWIYSFVAFAIWFLFDYLLNKWSLQRDADPEPRVPYWQTKFENISGVGVVTYAILLTGCSIFWVMSLDPTWYSTVYGLQFLVGQGYGVLALVILTLIGLSPAEPIKTIFRVTEQHDLGKLCFAFTMLNMYLAFASFLIIWSGNSPEEIPWYLDRIRGNWGVIATLDVIFHWLIPFSLLLSRDLKRIKGRLVVVCCIMIFARCWDMWWLIEPNFADARRNLHFSFGMLEYATVPVAMIAIWMAYYFTQLTKRPLVAVNDPHLAEILEPEHAHA